MAVTEATRVVRSDPGLTGRRLALLVVLPALAAGGLLLTLAGGVPQETPVGLPEPGG